MIARVTLVDEILARHRFICELITLVLVILQGTIIILWYLHLFTTNDKDTASPLGGGLSAYFHGNTVTFLQFKHFIVGGWLGVHVHEHTANSLR